MRVHCDGAHGDIETPMYRRQSERASVVSWPGHGTSDSQNREHTGEQLINEQRNQPTKGFNKMF